MTAEQLKPVWIDLEKSPEIAEVELLVRKQLAETPPTLGHGYSHFKKVARLAFSIALENNFERPEISYVVGLLHDLYRPAEGKAGQEEHEEETVKIAKDLLRKTKFSSNSDEIERAMFHHDEAIQKGESTLLMEILSVADKADMSFQRAIAYSWASNRVLKEGGVVAYKSFCETMRDFCLYQVKAWKVFLAVRIKGVDRAVEAYLQTDEDLIRAVRNEYQGKTKFTEESVILAQKEAKQEVAYLSDIAASEEEITKITTNFTELL